MHLVVAPHLQAVLLDAAGLQLREHSGAVGQLLRPSADSLQCGCMAGQVQSFSEPESDPAVARLVCPHFERAQQRRERREQLQLLPDRVELRGVQAEAVGEQLLGRRGLEVVVEVLGQQRLLERRRGAQVRAQDVGRGRGLLEGVEFGDVVLE